MTPANPRRRSLELLRLRDREHALAALEEALEQSEKIASDLETVQCAISALKGRMEAAHKVGQVTAERLQMLTEGEQITKSAIRKQTAARRQLEETEKDAAVRLARAKDAVAKAQKAIAALDRIEDED